MLMKFLTRRIRSLFIDQTSPSCRSRQRSFGNRHAESLEERLLLVVGAFAVPDIVLPGEGYDGVVRLTGSNGVLGSGVLLDDGQHVLTAAHVLQDIAGRITVDFILNKGDGTPVSFEVPVSDQSQHPNFTDPSAVDANDIAVLRLPEVAPVGAERFSLYAGTNEVGHTISFAGYGATGSGEIGATIDGGQLHAGKNQVSSLTPLEREFVIDFDRDDDGDRFLDPGDVDSLSDGVGLGASESSIAPGDSGGPAFINNAVAGISIAGTDPLAAFGTRGWFTRVSQYHDFVRGAQSADGLTLKIDMNNQPDGNDGIGDTIEFFPFGTDLLIYVNGEEVFNSIEAANDTPSIADAISGISFVGSNDGEIVTVNREFGSMNTLGTFELKLDSWTNYFDRFDVNGDGSVSPLDALVIVNELKYRRDFGLSQNLGDAPVDNQHFYNVNGDDIVSALDALHVINEIAERREGRGGEGELPPSSLLGAVDFLSLQDEDLSGVKFYEFSAEHTGTLTVETLNSGFGGNVDIELYNGAGLVPIAASSLLGSDERVDVNAEAGDTFVLKVIGSSSDFGLRINNLVNLSGTEVFVTGTAHNDSLDVTINSSDYAININGTDYSFPDSSVSVIWYNAGDGHDSVSATTGPTTDYSRLYESSYTVTGTGYLLAGSEVESKSLFSTGGNDSVWFYDSDDNDVFEKHESYAFMSGPGYHNRTEGFYRNTAYSSGGYDTSYLYDTAGNDVFIANGNVRRIHGVDYITYAIGFESVYSLAYNGGVDKAYFYDTAGDDKFYARHSYSYMQSGALFSYQAGFEIVYLYGNNGGTNTLDEDLLDFAFAYYGNWTLL